ncbi:MAG: ABC transporter ATP-binding protein [Candidatus Brocadiia bacterium]
MPHPALELQGLTRMYGEFLAVDHIDLAVERGEIFSLLGPNGSGKTTTIKMIMGLLKPSSGSAMVLGLDCFSEHPQVMARVGYMPDEPAFYDFLTGAETIMFVGEMHGISRRDSLAKSRPLLDQFELADAAGEYAVNYSRGMKKKLALICALLHDPDLLLLDEPTSGLDPFATRALTSMISALAESGKTIFFSTHILEQAEKISTRIGILHKSKLAAVGKLNELRAATSSNSSLEEIFFLVAAKAEHEE